MSLLSTLATTLNKPTFVAAAGVATVAVVFPMMSLGTITLLMPISTLQWLNLSAFALNCTAVSVPGRIDGLPTTAPTESPSSLTSSRQDQQDTTETTVTCGLTSESNNNSSSSCSNDKTRSNSTTDATTNTTNKEADELRKYFSEDYVNVYSPSNGRSLISPAGWAFAIWGPIYMGEAVFSAYAQFVQPNLVLPSMTVPFVAANVFQSLWCAAFRPAYYKKRHDDSSGGFGSTAAGWISPFMLAGTALSLSQVHAAAAASGRLQTSWFLVPLTMHFGWTTAATLVNINGALAATTDPASRSDCIKTVAVGHGSAVLAAVLGVGITLFQSSPAYGLTIAWALAACADGMNKRLQSSSSIRQRSPKPKHQKEENPDLLRSAILMQNKLCWVGAAACSVASISLWMKL